MDTQSIEQDSSLPGSAERLQYCVMVCVGYNPISERLIRRAAELAQCLHGRLVAVHVASVKSQAPGYQTTLETNLALARELGADVQRLEGEDIAQVLAAAAARANATHIVMGESARSRIDEIVHGSLVRQVLRASRGVDVYIVADPA